MFPKQRRRELERKWGFAGLAQELGRSGDPEFGNIGAPSVGYSVGSHGQHMTYTGIAVADERSRREPEREQAANKADEARLISDIFGLLLLRLGIGYRFVGASFALQEQASKALHSLTEVPQIQTAVGEDRNAPFDVSSVLVPQPW
jgi:hypothetical protein